MGTIWTPFYRLLVDDYSGETAPNFHPYSLFCLNTKLTSWACREFNPALRMSFPTKVKPCGTPFKRYLTVVPLLGGEEYELTEEMVNQFQSFINSWIDDGFCILVTRHEIVSGIPTWWIDTMIPYLKTTPSSRITKDGLEVNLLSRCFQGYDDNGKPDVVIKPYTDWNDLYKEMYDTMIGLLKSYYANGYIVAPTTELINNWKLTQVTQDLYYFPYKYPELDKFYHGLTSFLLTRSSGEVDIEIGPSWVTRHWIASRWLPYISTNPQLFDGNLVRTNINNLDELEILIGIIREARLQKGYVYRRIASTDPEAIALLEAGKRQGGCDQLVSYRVADLRYSYVVSCLFENEVPNNFQLEVEQLSE